MRLLLEKLRAQADLAGVWDTAAEDAVLDSIQALQKQLMDVCDRMPC